MPLRSRRTSLAVLVIVSAAFAAHLGARSAAGEPQRLRSVCGGDRWTVKTLQDRPGLIAVKETTVAYLVSLPQPAELQNTRLPFERYKFQVIAAVTSVRSMYDRDLHFVLRSGDKHMIAEAPASSCTTRATAFRRRQMAAAREAVRLCTRARVTGVAFFDFEQGLPGEAPNVIELHPILGFTCLS
jgi:hypothetical protein